MKKHPNPFTHPLFLAALFLLLLNDFWLKAFFPGAFTGKLSDITGVFVFTVFGLALLPRYRVWVAFGCAVWFIYWKSPASQPLIDSFNALGLYPIHRVTDYTDLWALCMVPAAWLFVPRQTESVASLSPVKRVAIPLLCLFAFCATSRVERLYYTERVYVDASKPWTTRYSHQQVQELFGRAAVAVVTDTATGEQLLTDIYINDSLTFDVLLKETDMGKKRQIGIREYYVCYHPPYGEHINARILNRMLYKKLNSYLSGNKKPL